MTTGQELYGLNWPLHQHPSWIELTCWRKYESLKNMPGAQLLPRHIHMKNAIQIMFPEKFTVQSVDFAYEKRGYIWNKWMERRCESFAGTNYDGHDEFTTWWGCSASGKSTDAAVLALMMWLSSPQDTTVIVMSTTRDALEQRIWREVVKYYKMREDQFPGEHVPSKTAIYYDKKRDTLSGIHGFAVQKGTIQDALGNIIGRHNTNVYVIIDEMQATREAAVDAWDNLSSGCEDCRFLGMGNPASKLDPLGSRSIPIKGWASLSDQNESWITPYGRTLYFDGMKSPGVDDPERFPFLLTQKQIDKMVVSPGIDSPRFWMMRRGFLPPDGLVWAVLNESLMAQYHVLEQSVWKTPPTRVVGIDPAYSADGDKCILYPAFVGIGLNGKTEICFGRPVQINLVAVKGKSMLDDLTDKICAHLLALDCRVENCGMDCTGNQWMLADAIEAKMNQVGLMRVSFAGSASTDPISQNDPRPAKELYSNRVTELWARFGVYIKNDMIRGLAESTCKEFCIRLIDFDRNNLKRVTIETKTKLKDRLGFSPDEADACVVALDVVRKVLGVLPEVTVDVGGVAGSRESIEAMGMAEEELWDEDGYGEGEGAGSFLQNFGVFDEDDFL